MTTDPTAALARIQQMADYWEQHLPEVIRTPAVVSALRAALESVVSVPSPPAEPDETDEQRADREETERDHARGDHTHCGVTCEVELPTEHLRNFVVAKGYPGTKGALDELLRRARAEAAVAPPADRAAELSDRERAMLGFALEMAQEEIYARSLEFTNEDKAALKSLRRLADEAPAATPDTDDLPARLEAVLTERYTELGNPFSEMRRHEQGPDGWPASHPIGPRQVADVLRELLTDDQPAANAQQGGVAL